MLRLTGPGPRLHGVASRREILRIGSLGVFGAGLSLADLMASTNPDTNTTEQSPPPSGSFGRAKSCIILFLMGGPPQHSTWDPKPGAPAEVKGDFGPIDTVVPGFSIGELLPRTALHADKFSILRAMSTGDNAHSSSGYYMLTGRPHQPKNMENANPGPPNDSPSLGALLGSMGGHRGGLPPAVTLPGRIFNTDGSIWPGQDAGFLGRGADPWLLNGRLLPDGYRIQEIDLPAELDLVRLGRRRDLLDGLRQSLDQHDPKNADDRRMIALDRRSRQAFDLLGSPRARRAFRLDEEPESSRLRYGETPFGQGALLARRLVEAGVRLVQVNWHRGPDEPSANPCWDSHSQESARLKNVLMPPMDAAYSALLEDLDRRGLLEETLVVCMAEFGRSPRLDSGGGRGHWGAVFSVTLAGGGIRGGRIFGASDKLGASPREGRVTPEDLSATIFHCLGHSPAAEYLDPLGRPHVVSRGEVLHALL